MIQWTPGQMIPQYDTVLFTDVYNNAELFIEEYKDCGIPALLKDDSVNTLFYLLYARYGNNPIANYDVNQFKYKLFSTIFQYGPTWEKRLELQAELRGLSLKDAAQGAINIYNHSFNDSAIPTQGNDSDGISDFINDQNVSKNTKSILNAASELWELLKLDITESFIDKFRYLFLTVVSPQITAIYTTVNEEE